MKTEEKEQLILLLRVSQGYLLHSDFENSVLINDLFVCFNLEGITEKIKSEE
jgi:hypothetical protein